MKIKEQGLIKNIIVIVVSFLISMLFGLVFNDNLWGTLTLFFGFLNAYYMALGKWQNYLFGLLFTLTYAYICAINGLYGWLIFSVIFYIPVQVYGLINWFNNKKDKEVQMRSFTLKNSIIICSLIVIGSVGLSFLLSLIPSQNLAFLDSASQIINICGVILVAIRFRECWYVWFANNLIDLIIWIVNTANGTANAEMVLITSLMYFAMNIIGLICWIKIGKLQKKSS